MTIDPMAAVGTVSEPAGSAASTETPASGASHEAPIADPNGAAPEATMDLIDYSAKQPSQPPAIETLAPEGQAKYLSNPSALGEKVLEQIEGLHQRSLDYQKRFGEAASADSASTADRPLAGPAAQDVAGSAKATETSPYDGLKLMFDYAAETRMISMTSSQFVSAINTLLKGQ